LRERVLPGGKKVEETCYAIDGALRPEEVKRLVERTKRIRGEERPVMERCNTAPVLGNKFRETHVREVEAATRRRDSSRNRNGGKTGSASNTSDEDVLYSPTSSSRHRSKSRRRHDSPRGSDEHYRERERGASRARSRDDREGKRKGGGSGKMQTATKIAAGAGLATLLDGLPEMLSYL
jgi:hypothetical protein